MSTTGRWLPPDAFDDYTSKDILEPPGADPAKQVWDLGHLSANFESGPDGSRAVGYDSMGGASYGKYQIATRPGTMARFMQFLDNHYHDVYEQLVPYAEDIDNPNGKFSTVWRRLADKGTLDEPEHEFIKRTHYDPALQNIENPDLYKMIMDEPALQDVLWSTAVQHGSRSDIFNKVFKPGMGPRELVNAVYNERATRFGGSNHQVRNSILARFDQERADALDLLAPDPEGLTKTDLAHAELDKQAKGKRRTKKATRPGWIDPTSFDDGQQSDPQMIEPWLLEDDPRVDELSWRRQVLDDAIGDIGIPSGAELRSYTSTALRLIPEIPKMMLIDFPVYYGSKWAYAAKASILGTKKPESEILTDEELEAWRPTTAEEANAFAEALMAQIDRGFRTLSHPVETARFGEPPERTPEVMEILEGLGTVFEAPKEYAFKPVGDFIGRLFRNDLMGELTSDAMDVLFWVLGPWYAIKGGGRVLKHHRRKQSQKVKDQIEASYQQELGVKRQSLANVLANRKVKEGVLQERIKTDQARVARQKEYEARQLMYENLFSEPNVRKFLDSVEAYLANKKKYNMKAKEKKKGELTSSYEVGLLYNRWLERMGKRDLELAKDWQVKKMDIDRLGIEPVKYSLEPTLPQANLRIYDRSAGHALLTDSNMPPGKSDLRFGVEAGRIYPKTSAAPDSLIVPGEKSLRLKRDILGHKADQTLKQKMRVPKKKEVSAVTQEVLDSNKTARQADAVGKFAKDYATQHPKPPEKPKVITKKKGQTKKDAINEALRIDDAAQTTQELPGGAKVSKKTKPKDVPPTTKTTTKAKPDRLAMIKAVAEKQKQTRAERAKKVADDPDARAQAEADAYYGLADDLEPRSNPFRDSLLEGEGPRSAADIASDVHELGRRFFKDETGAIDFSNMSKAEAAIVNRLIQDIIQISRKAAHDGKTVAQWLMDNQYVRDPAVAQALQSYAEGTTAIDYNIARPSKAKQPGKATPDGTRAHRWLDECEAAEKQTPTTRAKGLWGKVMLEGFAGDPDVRISLTADRNPNALKVLHAKINAKGALPYATEYWAGVREKIFKPLNKSQKRNLNRLIALMTQKDIFRRHPDRTLPKGLRAAADLDLAILEFQEIRGLSDRDMRILKQAADDYYSTMNDLLNVKTEGGAITPWLRDILLQNKYSPTKWLEVMDRLDHAATTSRDLSMAKLPKTFEEFQAWTGGREGLPPDLSIKHSGVRELMGGRRDYIRLNAEELMVEMISGTFRWTYANKATQWLGKYATEGTNPNVMSAKVKKWVDTPDGTPVPVYRKPPSGKREIHYFEDGMRHTLWADDWFASQWTNNPVEIRHNMNNFLRIVSGSGVLREFATGAGNPFFFIRSIPMDWMHLYVANQRRMPDGTYRSVYSPHLPVYSAQLLNDLRHVIKDVYHKDGRYADYFKEGGGVDFLTSTDLSPKVKGRAGTLLESWRKYFAYMNRHAEICVRLAHRERLIKQGVDPWEATAMARDRLDYSQGGRTAKTIDSVIPYTNAAAQASKAIFRAWYNDPATAAYKTANLAALSAGLYATNSLLFGSAYDQLNTHDRVGYWNIPTGITTQDEFGQDMHYFIKLRLDPGQSTIKAATELAMAAALGDDVRFNQLWLSVADMAPVFRGLPLPPVMSAAVAYGTNTDPMSLQRIYTGSATDPHSEWTQRHTSRFYKDMATPLQMSPDRYKAMVEQMITINNPYLELGTAGYDFLFDNVEQKDISDIFANYITDNVARRSLFSVTRPGPVSEVRHELRAQDREEAALRSAQRQRLERLLIAHYQDDRVPFGEIRDFIRDQEQQSPGSGERLINQHELFIHTKDLPERTFFMQLAGYETASGRADAVYKKLARSSPEKRRRIWEGLIRLQDSDHPMIPRSDDSEFWIEFGKRYSRRDW